MSFTKLEHSKCSTGFHISGSCLEIYRRNYICYYFTSNRQRAHHLYGDPITVYDWTFSRLPHAWLLVLIRCWPHLANILYSFLACAIRFSLDILGRIECF